MQTPTTRIAGSADLIAAGDAGHEAAARERDHHRVQVRAVLEQLEPDGALAGDDVGMVEGRQLDPALLGDEPVDLGLGIVLARADHPHLGPKGFDRRHLDRRHQPRQADTGRHAEAGRGIGHRPPVVAGRGADHAPLTLFRAKAGQRVGGTADLEGTDRLCRLQLEQDLTARRRQPGGRNQRRPAGDPMDRFTCLVDVLEGHLDHV